MFPISDSIPPRKFPLFNILLISVTIFVFIRQLLVPNPDAFIENFALIPSLIDFSKPSTLLPFITAIFLHGGILHIGSNLWFLWVFGDNVEDHFGKLLFLLVYLGSGIIGNLAQYLLMPNSDIPMLGASGAIAGILGAYYILYKHSKIKTLVPIFIFPLIVEISAPLMLGYWFLLQIFSGTISLPFSGESGGIAFFAHAAGFVSGVVAARITKGFHLFLP